MSAQPHRSAAVLRLLRRFLFGALILAGVAVGALALLFLLPNGGAAVGPPTAKPPVSVSRVTEVRTTLRRFLPFVPPPPIPADCAAATATATQAAAQDNAASETTAVIAPFGAPEAGWATYAPLIAHEVSTVCPPESPGFAAALARWQSAHGAPATGRVDAPTLSTLATTWLLRRPFVRAMRSGCPPSPDEATLEKAAPVEAFGGKTILGRPGALDAYRRMVAEARTALHLAPPTLTLASGYRGPAEEMARCADGSCGVLRKAHCSAHRTGLAFDVYLGAAPGRDPFSTEDDNRLFQTRTPAYHWLVANADRFGFVPYPFEPWHWEWTGEPP
jgi:hypothetical protein